MKGLYINGSPSVRLDCMRLSILQEPLTTIPIAGWCQPCQRPANAQFVASIAAVAYAYCGISVEVNVTKQVGERRKKKTSHERAC